MTQDTTAAAFRPSIAEAIGALAFIAVALGGLLVLPVVATAEPDERIRVLPVGEPGWWVVVALLVAQAIVLLWAGRHPFRVAVIVALVPVVHALAIPGDTFSLTTVAVLFAVFWTVMSQRPRRLGILLPSLFLLVAAAQTVNEVRGGSALDVVLVWTSALQGVAVVALPLIIGLYFAARRDARVSRQSELRALQGERDALVQAAVARERIAMSRELHDIAAHHVSGIALLSSAISRQIDSDAAAAKRSAQLIRAQSTAVLDDLRRVIGLLRDESAGSRSVESLASVRELIESRRAAGADVAFVVAEGDERAELGAGIGPLAQLVAFRMVQESLANAAAHAPGADCVVEIDDRLPQQLTVTVENGRAPLPDPGPGGGFGLVGMEERAQLVGARLYSGGTDAGGWRVRLIVPREPPTRAFEPEEVLPA